MCKKCEVVRKIIDYNFVELGMFGSYTSTWDLSNDNIPSPNSFQRKLGLLVESKSSKCLRDKDYEIIYTTQEKLDFFCKILN